MEIHTVNPHHDLILILIFNVRMFKWNKRNLNNKNYIIFLTLLKIQSVYHTLVWQKLVWTKCLLWKCIYFMNMTSDFRYYDIMQTDDTNSSSSISTVNNCIRLKSLHFTLYRAFNFNFHVFIVLTHRRISFN